MSEIGQRLLSTPYGLGPGGLNCLDSQCCFEGLAVPAESLRNGMWPRSAVLWMAAFWIALFIIRPWEKMFPELASLHVARVYAICMLGAVILGGKLRLCLSLQTFTVAMFVAGLTVSSVCALDQEAAWEVLYVYFTLVAFYFVLLSVIRTPYELVFIAACYSVTMALYLGKSQVEYFFFGEHFTDQGLRRLAGCETTYGGPNAVAESTVLSLPILVFLWQVRKDFTRTWPAIWREWFARGLVVFAWLALTSILLTYSRAGMLGFAVFVSLSVCSGRKLRNRLLYAICGVIFLAAVWAVVPEKFSNRLRTVWAPEVGPISAHFSAQGRIKGMNAGLAMFERFPVLGVGPGNFIAYRVSFVDGIGESPHSLLGQSLGETGLVGAVTFLLLIGAIFVGCRRTKVLTRSDDRSVPQVLWHLATACQNVILLALFHGLFGHNLYRFNWLWMTAFALLVCTFAKRASWTAAATFCPDDKFCVASS